MDDDFWDIFMTIILRIIIITLVVFCLALVIGTIVVAIYALAHGGEI